MTRVKICGITTREDLDAVVDAGADAVGFTVDVPVETPRKIDADLAAELVDATPPFVTTVLVTMPTAIGRTIELVETVRPDVVQIHGDLTPDELADFAATVRADVIKAVSPDDAERYDTAADALLVDSLDASGAGGTGERHDWTRTRELVATLASPIVLAGGLTPENVADAVENVVPFGVDVASGVEAWPGRKDPSAVSSFVARAGDRP
ncbi:MAG: phosphoribosylanthranilate isomerase [Natronomonas sp.]|jgi:phosphoribosylanthranilate isomerase|uniref:N-(5'-phosphoribosyl)anthranilate isomerase n=1 Tax=Natronomonas salsuginis TaxID=2217661 RepID=A0A4U5JGK0_9EURY|nr:MULTISPECIES: phosphoribosylanthranilate isomerase [Natronomonas]MDR9429683.1 phosphoribosylanthranilate isomerase [Natronomonas sp.]TKR27536.1 phosphoribosylanthranilate isomerase [Natronomonas salsuginis]